MENIGFFNTGNSQRLSLSERVSTRKGTKLPEGVLGIPSSGGRGHQGLGVGAAALRFRSGEECGLVAEANASAVSTRVWSLCFCTCMTPCGFPGLGGMGEMLASRV